MNLGIIHQSFKIWGMREARVNALIDTGAELSVIREDIARKIGASPLRPYKLIHSDGKVEKTVIIPIRIMQYNRMLDFQLAVSKRIDEQMIIGADFLQSYEGYIDMKKERIVFNKFAPKMPRMAKLHTCKRRRQA
jgi:predicted aspartyl protease